MGNNFSPHCYKFKYSMGKIWAQRSPERAAEKNFYFSYKRRTDLLLLTFKIIIKFFVCRCKCVSDTVSCCSEFMIKHLKVWSGWLSETLCVLYLYLLLIKLGKSKTSISTYLPIQRKLKKKIFKTVLEFQTATNNMHPSELNTSVISGLSQLTPSWWNVFLMDNITATASGRL